jgi:hypothetical protein
MKTGEAGRGEFAGAELVPKLVDAGEVHRFEETAEGGRESGDGKGGLPVNQDGAPSGTDKDVAGVVEVEVDPSGSVGGADAAFQSFEKLAGDGFAEHREGYPGDLGGIEDVGGIGTAAGIAEGESGAEILPEAPRGEAADTEGHDAGGCEPEEDVDFPGDEKTSNGGAHGEGAGGEILFDVAGTIGVFDKIDSGVQRASEMEELAGSGHWAWGEGYG